MPHKRSAKWLEEIEQKQTFLPTEECERAVSFLLNCRTPGAGWGLYSGATSNLRHTAVVLEALITSAARSSTVAIQDAEVYFRKSIGTNTDRTLDELIHCHAILHNTGSHSEIVALFRDRLAKALLDAVGTASFSTRLLSLGICQLSVDRAMAATMPALRHALVQAGGAEGFWPALQQGPPSLMATALAIRALRRSAPYDPSADVPVDELRVAFVREIRDKGWTALDNEAGCIGLAEGLRALQVDRQADYELIDSGIELLRSRRNSDGGWPIREGESSSIEATALTLIALIACGEASFVKSKLARTVVVGQSEQLELMSARVASLECKIDETVKAQCQNIILERDELAEKLANSKRETASLRKAINDDRDTASRANDGSIGRASLRDNVIQLANDRTSLDVTVLALVLAGAGIIIFADGVIASQFWMGVVGVATSVFASLAIGVLTRRRVLQIVSKAARAPNRPEFVAEQIAQRLSFLLLRLPPRQRERMIRGLTHTISSGGSPADFERILNQTRITGSHRTDLESAIGDFLDVDPALRRMVADSVIPNVLAAAQDAALDPIVPITRDALLAALESLPGPIREEVVYRIVSDLATVPAEVGRLFVRDIVGSLSLPGDDQLRLETALLRVLRLDPSIRELLFEQVRRVSLR